MSQIFTTEIRGKSFFASKSLIDTMRGNNFAEGNICPLCEETSCGAGHSICANCFEQFGDDRFGRELANSVARTVSNIHPDQWKKLLGVIEKIARVQKNPIKFLRAGKGPDRKKRIFPLINKEKEIGFSVVDATVFAAIKIVAAKLDTTEKPANHHSTSQIQPAAKKTKPTAKKTRPAPKKRSGSTFKGATLSDTLKAALEQKEATAQ